MTNNNDNNAFEIQDENEVNLRDILNKYIIHWAWFLISLFIALGLGFAYIKLTTPQYKIETDLLIKDNNSNVGGQTDLLKDLDLFSSDKIIDNEIEILKSNTILEKVVRGLNLQTSYFSTSGVRQRGKYLGVPFRIDMLKDNREIDYSVIYSVRLLNANEAEINGKKYPVGLPVKIDAGLILITRNADIKTNISELYDVKFNAVSDVVDLYSKNLNITPVSKQGTVLIITLEDAIPQRGKDFLNRLIDEYNRAAIADKNKVTSTTLAFITDRLVKLQEELGSAEKKVENYKSGNKITDISSQSQIFLQGVQGNDAELSKVNIQLSVLKNVENYLYNARNEQAQVPSMLGIEDPTLLALVQQLGEAHQRKQSLLQTIPETNPIVTSVNDQINALKSNIKQSVQNLKSGLQVTRKQLENKNATFQSVISQVPSKERGLLDVMRQQEIKNNLFTYLLQKREETEISLASTAADSRTIDVAFSSKKPVKPIKMLIFFVSFLLGLLIPAGIIYLRDLLNFRVSKRSDIERVTKVPILAEVSHSNDASSLLVAEKPRSMVAEQLRALRTNLNFVIPGDKQKTILFTSSISGEGKSFISLNLGASLALSGKKVVILELDLRKPKLHAGLDINNAKGLSNYLIGEVSYKDILKPIPQQKDYFIITSGPIPPNPAELLLNGKIESLLEELRNDFDYILIDAPPVGLVTDAQILAAYADTTIFIVRHNYTAKMHVHGIENFHKSNKFPNLNIVMNSIDISGGYGYSYGYGYGYGDGGYYQEDTNNSKRNFFNKLFKK